MRDGVLHVVGNLNNRQDPIKLGAVSEDDPIVSFLKVAQNIDIDDRGVATTRSGQEERLLGNVRSLWVHPQDDTIAYFLEGYTFKQLNIDFTATTIATMNSDNDISYELINGMVFLSNGVDIGYIENGAFVPFSQTLLRDELPMPAGKYIAYNDNDGCLLVASGSIVYKSKPWNPMVRDARYSEFPMNGDVRMLATVEDGWFVATEKNVSFAKMDGEDGYNFKHFTDSVPPDGAFLKEYHFDEEKGESTQMRVVWASPDGFIEGTAGGNYENHSYPNVALPVGNKGKVYKRNVNGTYQYVAVIFNPEDDNNYVAPTLLKNRITP